MTTINSKIDMLWDDNPIDVTAEANFIWSIANKLRVRICRINTATLLSL